MINKKLKRNLIQVLMFFMPLILLFTSCTAAEHAHVEIDNMPEIDSADTFINLSFATGINWLGEYAAAPVGVNVSDAYFNTVDGQSYVWDGADWDTLAEKGAAGADGAAGGNITNSTVTDLTGILVGDGSTISVTADNHTNWDTAYGWGDHSLLGYLTTESDPVYLASNASSILGTNITNWNTAYSWGDHSTAGYMSSNLTDSYIFVGNASNTAIGVTAGGDVSLANNGTFTVTGLLGAALPTLASGYLSYNGTAWVFAAGGGGSGTVTSVGMILPGEFTVTGSPVTTAGNLTAAWGNQTQNLVFASPDGSTGTPTFRALAASDIPDLSGTYLTAESDPVFVASTAYTITSGNITNWNTAYAWGNHSAVGYLTAESDPVFIASDAFTITSTNITNWNTAYNWGNHSAAGYLTAESDPVYGASVAAGIVAGNITNWNTAYGWGNHSAAGYIVQETDPVFRASTAFLISAGNLTDWDEAHSWGDHSSAGYLTAITGTELDNIWSSNGILVRTGAATYSVIADNSTNWDAAYGWGDHSLAGYLTSGNVTNWDEAYAWGNHAAAGYLTAESDPVFLAAAAAGIVSGNITAWDTAYGWGNHAAVGYLTAELDSVFLASAAAGIVSGNITNWNTAYAWGNHSAVGYLTAESDPIYAASSAALISINDNYTLGFTLSGNTTLTLPTSGTLATTATKLDDFGAPDDNTDLNASTSAHGLLPRLSGNATDYLDGQGNWTTPAGGGGSTVIHALAEIQMVPASNSTTTCTSNTTFYEPSGQGQLTSNATYKRYVALKVSAQSNTAGTISIQLYDVTTAAQLAVTTVAVSAGNVNVELPVATTTVTQQVTNLADVVTIRVKHSVNGATVTLNSGGIMEADFLYENTAATIRSIGIVSTGWINAAQCLVLGGISTASITAQPVHLIWNFSGSPLVVNLGSPFSTLNIAQTITLPSYKLYPVAATIIGLNITALSGQVLLGSAFGISADNQ